MPESGSRLTTGRRQGGGSDPHPHDLAHQAPDTGAFETVAAIRHRSGPPPQLPEGPPLAATSLRRHDAPLHGDPPGELPHRPNANGVGVLPMGPVVGRHRVGAHLIDPASRSPPALDGELGGPTKRNTAADGASTQQPRAAGLDVHKMQITATVRLCPAGGGEPVVQTRTFNAFAEGLGELVGWLGEHRVQAATLEATGVYWIAPFEALEDASITACLVHAQHVKQLKGRKTDVADSVWLARVCQFGLARASHIPSREIRRLRPLTRYRRQLIAERSRVRNRVQKVIDRCGIRIGGVISDLFGVNGRRLLDGLARGDSQQTILASLDARMARKLTALGKALAFELDPNSRWLLRDLLHAYDSLTERVAMAGREVEAGVQPFADRVRLLETIPGVDRASACAIMVEVGTDLSSFPKAQHLAAWAGLCPGNRESAGKRCHAPTRRGSKVLRSVLVECAHGAVRTHQCQFRGYHQALTVRRGYRRAIVATAHKMLRVIFVILRDGTPYRDPVTDYEAMLVKRNAPRWIRLLRHHDVLQRGPDGTMRIHFA